MKKKENTKEYLMEVMSKLDKNFKPKLNEWDNYQGLTNDEPTQQQVAPAQGHNMRSREDIDNDEIELGRKNRYSLASRFLSTMIDNLKNISFKLRRHNDIEREYLDQLHELDLKISNLNNSIVL